MSDWLRETIEPPSRDWLLRARDHQNQLTKPPGSLGQLEALAVRLCAMQQSLRPSLERVAIRVFAADHGVVAEGVSAFPQAVTVEMIRNFAEGGAAISVLAASLDADFAVLNMGTATAGPEAENILPRPVAAGTENFCQRPAMSAAQLQSALETGAEMAEAIKKNDGQLFIGGEMGIGNTTAAAALACALLQLPVEQLVGLGTGVDDDGRQRKLDAVVRALNLHADAIRMDAASQDTQALAILQRLGGFEIAALVGAYLRCGQLAIPCLVDGFICSVAALLAVRINPALAEWLFYAHRSAEAGHGLVLQALDAEPLLQLDMRLGEASGAAVALPLLRMACQLHNGMATFAGAGVSNKA